MATTPRAAPYISASSNTKTVPEELTPDVRERIVAMIRQAGAAEPPGRVPSVRECMFCDVSGENCPDRIEKKQKKVSAGGMF